MKALPAIVLVCAVAAGVAFAATSHSNHGVAQEAGTVEAVGHWKIQSSANVQKSGQVVSRRGFSTQNWYPVGSRSTIVAGLLQNGKFPNVFYGYNLRKVHVPDTNHSRFQIPWWYRTTFKLPSGSGSLHTFIKINGIIPSADVWLNGRKIASKKEIAGAYTAHEIDVTKAVHAGKNVLAIRVYPASAQRDLIIGWVDWNPKPADSNMGVWRDVDIVRTGAVSLHDLHVISNLQLPGLNSATLTVKAKVRNETGAVQNVTVSGKVAGVSLQRSIHLEPHQSRAVVFNSQSNAALTIHDPKVWWPVNMGAHPLYHASLAASVNKVISDRAKTTFGIRNVNSHLTKQGYRQFVINGKPVLIRGAGWAPDMFLRDQPERLAAEFRYIKNMGLNAVRLEGKMTRPDFYKLADENGILILAGWECCDKWEAWAGTGGEPWDAADLKVARESMASEARRLRDHPSVIAFLIGSDNAPPPKIARTYVDALKAADWPNAIIAAASAQKTKLTGPSGMKMAGPYAWVPPNYWYADKLGGGFGFGSELGAGIDIPRLASLRNMMTPDALKALWSNPDRPQYHAAPLWDRFSSLKRFDTALAQTYGKPTSLADYVEKAQLANYANVRAQFEAYSANMNAAKPATGLIYWMLNNAWPGLHWHLISHDMNPAGAYFGAKKANQPVHIQYSYNNRAVMAINHTLKPRHDLDARIRVYDLDGSVRYTRHLTDINLPVNHAMQLAVIPKLDGLSSTYFVQLELMKAEGQTISRNVYWLSTVPAKLRWSDSTWFTTPVSRYANLKALQTLPTQNIVVKTRTQRRGDQRVTTVKITPAADAKNVALFVHAAIRQAKSGNPVAPITWSRNDVSLWPGESATLTAHYKVKNGMTPVVYIDGWNVSARSVSISDS